VRLLTRFGLECRKSDDPNSPTFGVYHAGAWDASAPWGPPTPLTTANTLEAVQLWLLDIHLPGLTDTQLEQTLTLNLDSNAHGIAAAKQNHSKLYQQYRDQGHTPEQAYLLARNNNPLSIFTGLPKLTKAQAAAKAHRRHW
jgi:hypothetical protein